MGIAWGMRIVEKMFVDGREAWAHEDCPCCFLYLIIYMFSDHILCLR